MTIAELQTLLDTEKFHHATYRNLNTIWEGLYIYQKAQNKFGFILAGSFLKNDTEIETAENLVRWTGISVGAYGRG